MSKMIFVNLPVRDLAAATRFYEALGCVRNPQFSDEKASSMVWADNITFQLLTCDYFATFTSKAIPDAHATCQVLLCISCDSREALDSLAEAAGGAGGKTDVRAPTDMGFLYNRAVEDPDGHVLELAWMDMAALSSGDAQPA